MEIQVFFRYNDSQGRIKGTWSTEMIENWSVMNCTKN